MDVDPHELLGIPADASSAEIRDARRRLAADHHPDRGGDPARMREINAAADALLRARARRDEHRVDDRADDWGGAAPETEPSSTVVGSRRIARDVPSFTVEALPVEAFEALVIVAASMGEVLDDDPPYRLDTYLGEPFDCWCRLDVVPDAGASTVSLALGSFGDARVPDIDTVRDAWVANLNALDWPGAG